MTAVRERVPLLTLVVGVGLALNQVRATLATWGKFILAHPGFADFGSYYVYARVGLHHGWDRLYDLAAQRQEWLALGGPAVIPWFPIIYPPPLAWLVAPFAMLPLPLAFAGWTALLMSLLLVTWTLVTPSRSRLGRWTALAATLALFPVLFALVLGQVLVVELAAVAVAFRLLARGREIPAGLFLTALVFKPQVAFLIPVVLLVVGRRRALLAWAAGSAAIAAIAAVTTGLDGLQVYGARLLEAAGAGPAFGVPAQFTLQGLLGQGPATRVLQGLLVVLALAVAYRHRGQGIAMPLAAALVGSMLATPYLHDQDLCVLLLAGGIALHAPLDGWQRAVLAAGYALLVVISYWGFGPWGGILGPALVILEVAWLGVALRVPVSGGAGRRREPLLEIPLDRTA